MVFGGDSCKNGVTADKGMGNDSAEDTWRGVRNEVTCSRTAQRRTPSDVPGGLLVSLLRVSAFSSDLPLSRMPRLCLQESRRADGLVGRQKHLTVHWQVQVLSGN